MPEHVCPTHEAFNRRARLALDLAVAGDLTGAQAAARELDLYHGALTAALLVWADTLISRTLPAQHQRLLTPPETTDPATRWAAEVITARLTLNKQAFVDLRLAVPRTRAGVDEHTMALLRLIADHLNPRRANANGGGA